MKVTLNEMDTVRKRFGKNYRFMSVVVFLSLWLAVFPRVVLAAGEEALLQDIRKDCTPMRSCRITLTFDQLPLYRYSMSGQRVDLVLEQAQPAAAFTPLGEDENLIKLLLGRHKQELVLSFLFRRPPGDVELEPQGENKLLLTVNWSAQQAPRPAMLRRHPGVRVQEDGRLTQKIYSPYEGKWRDFLRDFKAKKFPEVQPWYTVPPFPLSQYVGEGSNYFLQKNVSSSWEQAQQGDYTAAIEALKQHRLQAETKPKPAFYLAKAELQLRQRRPSTCLNTLGNIKKKQLQGRSQQLYNLLELAAQVWQESVYTVGFAVEDAEQTATSALKPWLRLLRAELYLAQQRPQASLKLLGQQPQEAVDRLGVLYGLRRADALAAQGELERAAARYRKLLAEKDLAQAHPYSLAAFSRYHYQQQAYDRAQSAYRRLRRLLSQDPRTTRTARSLAWYQEGRSLQQAGEPAKAMELYSELRRDMPDTAGGLRARMVLNDQQYLADSQQIDAAQEYRQIADKAFSRELRTLAQFKAIVVTFLEGLRSEGIDRLRNFLRGYQWGPLRSHAQALLVEKLRPHIKELIAQEKYLKALIHLEQNRQLLVYGAKDWPFLNKLGEAFTRLGLSERAARVYFYLLDVTQDKAKREQVYPLLCAALLDAGRYSEVMKQAADYEQQFPQGKHRPEVWYLWLQALMDSGQQQEAQQLALRSSRPSSRQLDTYMAAEVLWQNEAYAQAAQVLEPWVASMPKEDTTSEMVYYYAESAWRSGQRQDLRPYYQELVDQKAHVDLSRYRLAQIVLRQGDKQQGVKLLRQVAEEGSNELWQQMARERLAMIQLD